MLHVQACMSYHIVCDTDDDLSSESKEYLGLSEIHRKTIANAFWNYFVENELEDSNDTEYLFNGQQDRENYMNRVDENRVYMQGDHTCTEECKKRGMYCTYMYQGTRVHVYDY